MMSNLFIHTITAIRFAQTSQNSLGEPVNASSSVGYSSSSGGTTQTELKCRVEEYSEITQYRDSNARLKNETLVYLPATISLQEKDMLYWGSKHKAGKSTNEYIGIITGINPAYKGTTNTLDHWEITVENP